MGNTNKGDQNMETIKFIENHIPTLTTGAYKVSLTQELEGKLSDPNNPLKQLIHKEIPKGTSYQVDKEFYVFGERFNLRPLDVDSVFPPDLSVGKFDDCLPHLVLNEPSLPWQRRLDNRIAGTSGTPWMALLVFDEADPAPSPRRVPVSTLLNDKERSEGFYFPTGFKLDPGESPSEMVSIIDVPSDLFAKICPSVNDLQWMAHCRKVGVENKAKSKKAELNGEYAVVLGNRLPQQGKESIVHLVSLEDYGELLEKHNPYGGNSLKGNPILQKFHHVRLISYKKWRFKCETHKDNFGTLLKNLNSDSPKSNENYFPYPQLKLYKDIAKKGSGDQISKWLDNGFVPLPHYLRQGYTTISVYRGPLTPFKVPVYISNSIDNQDQLYFKDKESNVLDVSYACAWQLGQMLGLRNQKFTQEITRFKMQNNLAAIRAWEKQQLQTKFSFVENENGVFLPFQKKENSFKIPENNQKASEEDLLLKGPTLFERNTSKGKNKEIDVLPFPDYCQEFLDSFNNLQGVPFHYLVPDMEMLPPESLKFFYLDLNWINALKAGLMNIGDFALGVDKDYEAQKVKYERFLKLDSSKDETIHGFLLRSKVLVGWPGMEMFVYDYRGNSLPYVRIEKLADDIAVVMVKGYIQQVTFREPGEGLHFGVEFNKKKIFKRIKVDDKDNPHIKVGKDGKEIEIDISSNESGLLPFDELSKKLKPHKSDYSNADFAFIMVEGADQESFSFYQEPTA